MNGYKHEKQYLGVTTNSLRTRITNSSISTDDSLANSMGPIDVAVASQVCVQNYGNNI